MRLIHLVLIMSQVSMMPGYKAYPEAHGTDRPDKSSGEISPK
jgi:hypothetical protein